MFSSNFLSYRQQEDIATFFLLERDELEEIVKSVDIAKQLQDLQKQLLETVSILCYLGYMYQKV